jgi:hypothetical protein
LIFFVPTTYWLFDTWRCSSSAVAWCSRCHEWFLKSTRPEAFLSMFFFIPAQVLNLYISHICNMVHACVLGRGVPGSSNTLTTLIGFYM